MHLPTQTKQPRNCTGRTAPVRNASRCYGKCGVVTPLPKINELKTELLILVSRFMQPTILRVVGSSRVVSLVTAPQTATGVATLYCRLPKRCAGQSSGRRCRCPSSSGRLRLSSQQHCGVLAPRASQPALGALLPCRRERQGRAAGGPGTASSHPCPREEPSQP